MGKAHLIISQMGTSFGLDSPFPRQDALCFFLKERKSYGALQSVMHCGLPKDPESEHPERRYYCENRWCDVCLHRRSVRTFNRLPERAVLAPSWTFGTYQLAARHEVNADVLTELKEQTFALRKALPQSTFSGGLYFQEFACDESPTGTVLPHVHAILATQGEWAKVEDDWHRALWSLGVEASEKSLKPAHDRLGIIHYSQKRWRDEPPVPFARALEQIRIFHGRPLSGRFGVFRHPSRRPPPQPGAADASG